MTGKSSSAGRWVSSRAGWLLGLIFVCLAAGIVAAGYFYYRNYEKHYRSEVERQLFAIAELKVGELVQWRKERLGDAGSLFKNAPFAALVRRFFEQPEDVDARRQLQGWIGKIQTSHQYDHVFLLDARGIERLAVPDSSEPVPVHLADNAVKVLHSGQVTFLDFHRDAPDRPIYLGVLVPILDESEASPPLGVLVLRIDPATYLYPLLQRWPTPSLTAETLLVRREGNEVVFLNELRFQKNTALTLRAPLDQKALPAARAALGQEGVMEGIDYRGVPVVAALRVIPDSPWSLVARMDAAEVYAPLRERLWQMVVLIGAVLLGTGAGTGWLWRQQRVRFYREGAETENRTRRMATVVRDSNDAITIQDFEGRITAWNRGAELMYGYGEEEALQMSIGRLTASGKVEEQNDFTRRLLAGEKISSFETQRVTKDGRLLDVWLTVTKLVDDAGKVIGIASTERDITERKRAVEEVHKLNANLEQRVIDRTAALEAANKELEAFSYSVSHDLRAPLRAMDGFSMALLEDCAGRLDGASQDHLRRIRAGSQRMAELIDDLLNLSQVTRTEMRRERLDLTALAEEIGAELQRAHPDRKVKSVVAPALTADADARMLRIVLNNLLDNAWKFTSKHEQACIEVGAREQDGQRVFFVRDNGAGFDMAYAGRLFGAFQRLHSTQEFEGTGIGLAIVQRIIHRHGGRVWAEGAVGQGATVYFTLGKERD